MFSPQVEKSSYGPLNGLVHDSLADALRVAAGELAHVIGDSGDFINLNFHFDFPVDRYPRLAWLLLLDYHLQLLAHPGIELCELRDEFHCLTFVTACQVQEREIAEGMFIIGIKFQSCEVLPNRPVELLDSS